MEDLKGEFTTLIPLADTLALLKQMPASLDALLRPLPLAWIEHSEGGASWTSRQVIAHLVDNEHTNWLVRARLIRESDEVRAFPAVVRSAGRAEEKVRPLGELLDAFRAIREANLAEVEGWHLTRADLEGQAIHPVFGVVTLGQLLATWATHDLTHLHQIARALADRQREAVGPWIRYLGVLHCDGHGE